MMMMIIIIIMLNNIGVVPGVNLLHSNNREAAKIAVASAASTRPISWKFGYRPVRLGIKRLHKCKGLFRVGDM